MGIERLLLLATLLGACEGDVTVEGGGGATSGGAPGTGGSPSSAGGAPLGGEGGTGPVCPQDGECLAESGCLLTGDDGGCRVFECDLPSPCEEIEFTSPDAWGLEPPFTLETPDALACVLDALRYGTTGSYRWRSSGLRDAGGYGIFNTIHLHDGRIAIGSRDSAGDLGTLRDTLGPVALQAPSYFEGCAALSSGDAIWSCLGAWSLGCPSR